jgi:2-dehydro-3-deoxyphosphogluconate aldolase/(4S)-4-hydroxy-2-oxoglutarate aldolase
LPFCIAAGGLAAADATAWYAAGVDAIALGGALFSNDQLDPALHQLVVSLRSKCYP